MKIIKIVLIGIILIFLAGITSAVECSCSHCYNGIYNVLNNLSDIIVLIFIAVALFIVVKFYMDTSK